MEKSKTVSQNQVSDPGGAFNHINFEHGKDIAQEAFEQYTQGQFQESLM